MPLCKTSLQSLHLPKYCFIGFWLPIIGSISLLFMVLPLTFVLNVCIWSPQRSLALTHSSASLDLKYLWEICLSLRMLKTNLSQPACQVTNHPKTGEGHILCSVIVNLSSGYSTTPPWAISSINTSEIFVSSPNSSCELQTQYSTACSTLHLDVSKAHQTKYVQN